MPQIKPAPNQPVIPRSDDALFRFALTLEQAITDALYFLPVGTKATLSALRIEFYDRITTAGKPNTRNTRTIAQKNETRLALITHLRKIIRTIKNNFRQGLLSPARILNAALNLPKTTITQEPTPKFAPGLVLESQTAYLATLRLIQTTNRGSNTNTRLPTGVQNVQLLQKTTDNALHLIRSFTRPTVKMNLEPFAPGSDIVVAVRYLGSRQEPGPISQSLTIHVPA